MMGTRFRWLAVFIGMGSVLAAGVPWACGQSNASSASSEASSSPQATDWQRSGRSGGNSLADFTELINLIQTTVRDGNWDINGGEDTIQTSASGVWIDLKGKLKRDNSTKPQLRMPPSKADGKGTLFEIPQLGTLQPQAWRWISLNELEAKLKARQASQQMASPAMEMLGGLTKIEQIARGADGTWYLGGPAGGLVLNGKGDMIGRDTGLPPVLLEDLLSVAPVVLNGRGPLGCSIDPLPERLKAVSELAVSPLARQSLTRHAERWCDQLTQTLGDQQATVFGLPEDSPTAIALLIADEHMKRVGIGLENGPPELLSYWEEGEKRGAIPNSGLIRWWFALQENIRIGVTEGMENQVSYTLESPSVRVLSQKQWMDQTGARHDTEVKDFAADAFATGFTDNFDRLQQMYPAIYGRLRHIFDLCIAMRLIREEAKAKPFDLLLDPAIQPHAEVPLKWIPSIAAWRKTSQGRVAAIVSGGVAIRMQKDTLRRYRTEERKLSPLVPFALE